MSRTRDRCYGTCRTRNIISALSMCAAVATDAAKICIGSIFKHALIQAIRHTSACVGIKSTAQASMGFGHTRLISKNAGKERKGEKEREAPGRPGTDDDMTGTDKVLRDQSCIPQTLFVSREGSATGESACLEEAPTSGSFWGWLGRVTGYHGWFGGGLGIVESCRMILHPSTVRMSAQATFFARGREG